MDLRLYHPFTFLIAGPTQAGKSKFVVTLLQKGLECINTDFDSILWCYSEWYPDIPEVKDKIIYQKGLDDLEREDNSLPRLIVIDDLLNECDNTVVKLFTRGSHHTNTSVIFITQNIFHQSKGQRDISLNSHYITVFKNPRDAAQILHLARQIYPSNPKFIQEVYIDATKRPHGYLLFDLTQRTPDKYRIRTNIFGEEKPGYPIVYAAKNKTSHRSKK
jgi:hypothetical protein